LRNLGFSVPLADAHRRRYAQLRAELEHQMAQAARDMPRIDHLVDELEQVQLQCKMDQGLQGNNPNE